MLLYFRPLATLQMNAWMKMYIMVHKHFHTKPSWSSDPFVWTGHRLPHAIAIKLYCIVTTVTSNVASVLCLNSTSSVHRIWYLQFFLAEFVNVGFDFLRDGIIITNRLLFLKADSRIETEWTSWMSPHVSRPSFQNYSLFIMTSTVLFADMFLDLGGLRLGLGR